MTDDPKTANPTLFMLLLLGRAGLPFSNVTRSLVLFILAIIVIFVFLSGSKTPAELKHLSTNAFGVHDNVEARQELLGNHGDGGVIGLDSINSGFKSVDRIYKTRKVSIVKQEEERYYHHPLADNARQG